MVNTIANQSDAHACTRTVRRLCEWWLHVHIYNRLNINRTIIKCIYYVRSHRDVQMFALKHKYLNVRIAAAVDVGRQRHLDIYVVVAYFFFFLHVWIKRTSASERMRVIFPLICLLLYFRTIKLATNSFVSYFNLLIVIILTMIKKSTNTHPNVCCFIFVVVLS